VTRQDAAFIAGFAFYVALLVALVCVAIQ